MKPTITVDASQWKTAARQLFETDKRTCVDFTNGQALRVASFAVEETDRADAALVAAQLGQVSSHAKLATTNKRGRIVFKREKRRIDADSVNTLAARIIGRMWDKNGFNAKQASRLEGKSLVEQIKIFIGWRIRRTAFISSGWIPAIKKLSSVVFDKPKDISSRKGATQYGRDKGSAKPATFSMRSVIVSIAENNALKTSSELAGGDPMPIAKEGLQRALNKASRDMMEKLRQRRQRDFDKVNARR